MNDDDIRSLFTEVGTGPPVRLAPEQIIREGTRIRRRGKRMAIGVSALATGAAVLLISVVVSQAHVGSDRRIPAGPGPATPTTTQAPSPPSATPNPQPPLVVSGEQVPESAPAPGVTPGTSTAATPAATR